MKIKEKFHRAACRASDIAGTPWAFALALLSIILWLLSGSTFHYSDTWQLVINTGTTIITFLMVFLIQNAQNRDAKAIQLKLNELVRALHGARDEFVDLEEMSDDDLKKMSEEFHDMYLKLHGTMEKRGKTRSEQPR